MPSTLVVEDRAPVCLPFECSARHNVSPLAEVEIRVPCELSHDEKEGLAPRDENGQTKIPAYGKKGWRGGKAC